MLKCERCGSVDFHIGATSPEGTPAVCVGCMLAAGRAGDSPNPLHESFGRYEILCEIGQGGMGVVYLAEQSDPVRREVALKVLKTGLDTADVLRRFEVERQSLAIMKHPNIASFYDAGASSRGRPYFVMEFVEGEPITAACDRRLSSVPERLALFSEVCRALDHAHRKGVIHRDIKPSNVLLAEREGCLAPKVIDFGIARAASGLAGSTGTTAFGEFLGTPEYISPEQASFDGRTIGPAADIYSLGMLLYELLAGVLPFDSARLRESGLAGASRIILEEEPPAPTTRLAQTGLTIIAAERRKTNPEALRRLLSHDLARVVKVCLQKDPGDRYGSAAALADDIDLFLRGEPVLAHGPTLRYRTRKWLRRYRLPLGGAAIAGLTAGLALWLSPRPKPVGDPPAVRPVTSYPGTELHPSFSPDGKRVAFVWDGGIANFDIYVQPVDGGVPTRLTSDPNLDLFPEWSPDGREVAFVRVSPTEQSLRIVAHTGGPDRLIASLHNSLLNWVDNPAATLRRPGPAWSPDGKSLLIADSREPGTPAALYRISLLDGASRKLTTPDADTDGDHSPAFSPDGRTLAFIRRGSTRGSESIWLAESDGQHSRKLGSQQYGVPGLAWLSNRELLFTSNRSGPNMLWRIPVQGGTPQPIPGAGRGMNMIAYSRLTRRVVFAEQTSNRNVWRVRLRERSESSPAEKFLYSSRRTDSAEFSPDGKAVVYVSDRLGTRQIWVAGADGMNPVQLSSVASETPIGTPRWSPDGKRLVYDTVEKGYSAIAIMQTDGSRPHLLTSDPWDNMMPSWSHDGERIYFACKIGGTLQVCRAPAGGGLTTPITTQGGGEPRESPDGQFVYYGKARGLWQVPRQGGPETPLPGLSEVEPGRYWTVAGDAIYLVRSARKPWIVYRYEIAGGRMVPVAAIEKEPDFGSPGLALSPAQDWLLFGQIDEQGSDILLVEGVAPQ